MKIAAGINPRTWEGQLLPDRGGDRDVCIAGSGRIDGQTYQVQYKTDLRTANWKIASGNLTATTFRAAFADPINGDPQKFYWIVQLP